MAPVQDLLHHAFERLSNTRKPPADYTFVPKGDIYITRHCRQLTGKSGKTLYVVFNHTSLDRLGLHCPTLIYEEVVRKALDSAERRRDAVTAKDDRDQEKARETLMDLYPFIPPDTANAVLEHAFRKYSGRVGRSCKLESDVIMDLAVNAHIRHRHTYYDAHCRRLKKVKKKYQAKTHARALVNDQVKAIGFLWRMGRAAKAKNDSLVPNQRERRDLAKREKKMLRKREKNLLRKQKKKILRKQANRDREISIELN